MAEQGDYLEFFGVERALFVNKELVGGDLNRFVDREQILEYFRAALLGGNTCAVVGKQGTGKSSFLLKLIDEMKDSIYCDYLQFSFPPGDIEKSRLKFLRAILRSILNLILGNDELFNIYDKDEITFETKRLEYSITFEEHAKSLKSITSEADGGIKSDILNLMLPVEFKAKLDTSRSKEEETIETKDYPIHNETTLYDTIVTISRKFNEPIVLFIDELDKVGRFPLESPEWDKEVVKILELSREIMANEKIIMVFSLQHELYEKLIRAKRGEGDISIMGLINIFKRLNGFDLKFAKDAVKKSLEVAGYKKTMEDLIEKGVIEIVLSVVKGNPRLFMTYLIEMSINAFLSKQKTITLDILKHYLLDLFEGMGEKEWTELVSKAAYLY